MVEVGLVGTHIDWVGRAPTSGAEWMEIFFHLGIDTGGEKAHNGFTVIDNDYRGVKAPELDTLLHYWRLTCTKYGLFNVRPADWIRSSLSRCARRAQMRLSPLKISGRGTKMTERFTTSSKRKFRKQETREGLRERSPFRAILPGTSKEYCDGDDH